VSDVHGDLLKAAIEARSHARAPYSQFPVGAAVLGASGAIYTGSNVESSSYGLTLCAERLALCFALHQGETEITHIAVVADTEGAPGPCGACRQMMFDYAPDSTVVMANLQDDRRVATTRELMPWGFGPSDLAAYNSRREKGSP
jgi:cytidine deaminase